MKGIALGLAGEFRVMSELLLRGFNPAKSYLDNGVDIILENGKKIQVRTTNHKQKNNRSSGYIFNLTRGNDKKPYALKNYVDYFIGFIPRENTFLIMPTSEINGKWNITLSMNCDMNSKYNKYINNWEILGGE